ncbi:DUF5683 domain-containing protein [Croceitalea sp. MTPC9]|uniref:DUF5683 domain-containing protein n=1 Tax=unclassified Croceitalea TaxID=2632280 RepID=UPI002B3B120E|nr:DUF5683 domain-containing protein [Croceitalea sp. MTPC6]GMN15264.1 DUF5683 domain-containing protein [Croceitalea sp. MTPC9]
MGKYLIILALCLCTSSIFSQETKKDSIATQKADSLSTDLKGKGIVVEEVTFQKQINPLAPSKAAFLSAILPGMGQIYNKRYWKTPIVWAAIGTGIYTYSFNNTEYNRFRDAFKRRRAGFIDDEFYDINGSGVVVDNPDVSDTALQDAQNRFQEQRDLALLITILLYALNVVDANVDAHLKQYNIDDKLSMDFKPYLDYNQVTAQPNYGMALLIKF